MRKRSSIRSTAIAFVAVLGGLLAAPGAQAATFTVGSAGDGRDVQPGNGVCDTTKRTGLVCTLRAAIQEANALGGADAIGFEIGGSRVVKTISPQTALPEITQPVTIDGYTQPGASPNTQRTGDNARLLVELDGSRLSGGSGLRITAGQSLVQGLVVNDFSTGINLRDRGGNKLLGNFIGTDPSGTAGEGNLINLTLDKSSSNLIGGTAPAARNIVSDGGEGAIYLGASSANRIQGNYIGTDRAGTGDLGNGVGTGADPIHFNAISLGGASTGNRIGGSDAGAANIIAYTGWIGVDVFGDESVGNRILGNSIHDNGYMGINLADDDGITANDQGDADVGGNLRQNHPVIDDAARVGLSGAAIEGTLHSAPSTKFTVQFFSNPADEQIDEGQRYLGQTTVTTGAAGNAWFDVSLNTGNLTGAFVTATATDPAGNTSEFSPGRIVERPPIEG